MRIDDRDSGQEPGVFRPGFGGRVALVLVVLAGGAGCLDHELDPADTGGDVEGTFIALQRDFQAFRSWPRVQVSDGTSVGDGHVGGPRFVYTSRAPLEGAYPVGTILVKTSESGTPDLWQIHGRVKRGGTFNAQGAARWEWFDLRISATIGDVLIMWRGERAPTDHGYESLPGLGPPPGATDGDCNGCHGLAAAHDFILSPALQAQLSP